ncbi:uncharacterized protein BO80DRAFT_483291 [Aspergillus ibericus CBS 121593]|uniref:Uncharacterized protein n=1 Tax=Aspergillus ibericus CBS 121593 TaxID=1448316 RepID=A0A395HB00_9EURO|nr:hypothetical protein BO80DRAFT_483291 [Aspergillus ibericus CBS 121593]RAL04826.1 hypothetical protein BO80DRAFT_483291 [Aspergillus ibericus CBS 121593]
MPVQDTSSIPRLSAHTLNYAPPPSAPHLAVYDSQTLDIDDDGFLQSSQRAGGPYLCSLPAVNITPDPSWTLTQEHEDISQKTAEILTEADITWSDIQVTGRVARVDPEESIPTILVVVPDTTSSNWRDATKAIFKELLDGHHPNASVEIITSILLHTPAPMPIHSDDAIFSTWPQIRDTILEELDTADWTGLECWRYGRSANSLQNPPTIIVSVQLDSVRVFDEEMATIMQILARHDITDCAVLFMHDEFRHYALTHFQVPLARLEDFSGSAWPGMSIGIRDSSATSSTLGGVVEIQMDGDATWQRFHLSCFHGLYPHLPAQQALLTDIPGAKDALHRWQWTAPTLSDSIVRPVLRVDQPSLFDVQDAIRRAAPDEEKQTERQRFLDENRHHLGAVGAGSGLYRTRERGINEESKPGMLDWALIEVVQERDGLNQAYEYSNEERTPFRTVCNTALPPNTPIHNTGRKTGGSSAPSSPIAQVLISRARDMHGQPVTQRTYEHSVPNHSRPPFAIPGDAGSMVVAPDGSVLGMLVGGYVRKETVYYSHIKDVLDDIKEVTGAVKVRLAQD